MHKNVIKLRLHNGMSISETANICGVSERQVIRITKRYLAEHDESLLNE